MTAPGPGKFEFNESIEESEILYHHSLDGSHNDVGESDGFGWYILILSDTLTEDEKKHCTSSAYICREDEHGFFHVVPYTSPKTALRDFTQIEEAYNLWQDTGVSGASRS